ncbi:hypothetical protein [Streptomyces roseochromogenus]|uniref:Major facilitator superfamily (MFS) profile domain-containing protein n=1 Tax=Streptomyces roseochromogenus subsp. oscitans DS 12.976 TaxID=1352936 RepID=V6KXD6_STRRC|nr:hypothetical protein [Streptomyces roseochromogenus]EST36787.1 hypothetical protein M878_00660 [Streptomyces roseochromogenus subsp. oscitans DS 12.976]
MASRATLATYELRREEPLIEPRLLRSAPFTGAADKLVIGFCMLGGFLFLTTLYLQNFHRLSGVIFAGFDGLTHAWSTILGCAVFGLGFGFVNAPTTNTAVSSLRVSETGVAASLASTFRQTGTAFRQTGTALGVALIGAVRRPASPRRIRRFLHPRAARPAWWVIAMYGLTASSSANSLSSHPAAPSARPGTTPNPHPRRALWPLRSSHGLCAGRNRC